MMVVFADIVSERQRFIPRAKAYSDASAPIRKASTFSRDVRRVFVNRSLDYNEDGSAPVARGNTRSTIKKDK